MKQIEVQIMQQSYVLGCPDGQEARLLEAVVQVDNGMTRIRDAGKVRSRERIAVLTSLNLAMENAGHLTEIGRLQAQVQALQEAQAQWQAQAEQTAQALLDAQTAQAAAETAAAQARQAIEPSLLIAPAGLDAQEQQRLLEALIGRIDGALQPLHAADADIDGDEESNAKPEATAEPALPREY